jgi:hypothetical protein
MNVFLELYIHSTLRCSELRLSAITYINITKGLGVSLIQNYYVFTIILICNFLNALSYYALFAPQP